MSLTLTDSVSGNTLTNYGGVDAALGNGEAGVGALFSGSNCLYAADSASLSPPTGWKVSGYFYLPDVTTLQAIVSKQVGGSGLFVVYVGYGASGDLRMYGQGASGPVVWGGSISVNTWYFIEAAMDYLGAMLWLNVNSGTPVEAVVAVTPADDSVDFYIGAQQGAMAPEYKVSAGTRIDQVDFTWLEVGGPTAAASWALDGTIPTVTLSRNNATIAENGGVSTVTATLSEAMSIAVTVNLSFGGTATGGGVDYTASASSITITAGNLTGTMTVTGVGDGESDPDETIVIDVSSVTNALENGSQQVTITIVEGGGISQSPRSMHQYRQRIA